MTSLKTILVLSALLFLKSAQSQTDSAKRLKFGLYGSVLPYMNYTGIYFNAPGISSGLTMDVSTKKENRWW